MAKNRSKLSTTAQPVQVQAQTQAQATPPQQAQAAQSQQPQTQAQVDAQGFSNVDSQGYHDLKAGRAYFQRQQLGIDTRAALADYLDPNPTPGSLYNASQNMNYNIIHGTADAQQQFMYDSIVDGMHNLGENLNLTRYDHIGAVDGILRQVGVVGGYTGQSIQQLKQQLVGSVVSDDRILSTSYNNFANAKDPSTFTTREVKLTYRAKASTQALMPGVGTTPMRGSGMTKGDDFGEMLLGPTRNGHNSYKVVDVRPSGSMARPKGGSKYNLTRQQIEIVIEVE